MRGFGDVDMDVADRIALERLFHRRVAFLFGQRADAMTLQATMKQRAGQMRDRRHRS